MMRGVVENMRKHTPRRIVSLIMRRRRVKRKELKKANKTREYYKMINPMMRRKGGYKPTSLKTRNGEIRPCTKAQIHEATLQEHEWMANKRWHNT